MSARAFVLAFVLAAPPAAAEVRVQPQDGGLLSVEARGAPVSEVLDRLARQTGMQVVYEGAPPRLPVTLAIERRTPAEAVFSVLEGLGLNYVLRLDESSGRVLTLVMAGAAAAASPGAPTPGGRAAGSQPEQPHMPPPYPPPPSYPQEDEYVDPNAGVIPPPPPQPPQEFTITPPQQLEPQPEQEPAFTQPSLGSGFSSPFSSGGFSSPPIFGNTPPPATSPAPPTPYPGEPPPDEKQP
jgi:hypothetical protein